ncbi:MAG: preprotein translocase subunit Sec61beta [Candidatus Aenigmarchaeota archaeon]|nr:preprotein translocase subunit Sec61beta [Candidatus Aenigmarchaeota archaeon]
MAEKEDRSLPMGQAGLVRYFSTDEGIKIKPEIVIWLGIAFVGVVAVLKFFA